ncbi:site-2 protease family protein [Kordia sp.]|uniref:site-2 protease family protein n=1 Tax=Kordia sp. TaxID=1965332 RepID=UPI003B5A5D6C
MIFLKINRKLFLSLTLGFVLFTIIGTQTHELGHIAVAESLGYETTLSYGSMSHNHQGFSKDKDVLAWRKMFKEIGAYDKFSEEEKKQANELYDKIKFKFPTNPEHNFYITLGGPAQTILTCFIGLFILAYRSRRTAEEFKWIDWLALFLSLFVLREVFNTVMAGVSYIIKGKKSFSGDEFHISSYLGFNQWTVPIMTAMLGAVIASFVIFMILPKKYRFTCILAGFLGGISGFVLWFNYLGPWLFRY